MWTGIRHCVRGYECGGLVNGVYLCGLQFNIVVSFISYICRWTTHGFYNFSLIYVRCLTAKGCCRVVVTFALKFHVWRYYGYVKNKAEYLLNIAIMIIMGLSLGSLQEDHSKTG